MPPIRLTVSVKYFSTTLFEMPMASKICAPWYDWIVEMPILEAILTIPWSTALL